MTTPIYDSDERRNGLWGEARELWRYRDLLAALVIRNVKTRYKRSALGVAWTMLNPLLTMLVLALVFSALFESRAPHYPVYLLAGLLLWNFVAQTTTSAMNEMVWSSGLLKRVYVPRAIFVVAAVGTGLVNLAIALVPLTAIALLTGVRPTLAWLFLPVATLLAAAFATGLGLCLATLAAFYTDVIDMYQIVLMIWMYLTPVLYPASILPPRLAWLPWANPMAYLVDCFRTPAYLGQLPPAPTIAGALCWAGLSLIVGWRIFARQSDEFAYRL